jgi:sugar phosphate isomerase/epimerase
MSDLLSRRSFVRSSLACGAAAALPGLVARAAEFSPAGRSKMCLFEKPLQSLPAEELAAFTAKAGFDGIAATVRKNGRIAPERAPDELSKLVATLAKHRLEITELTTDITRADQPHAESVLRSAAKLGLKCYRLGSLKYDLARSIPAQLDAFRAQFRELAALNRELGMAGYYQVHAGASNVGAPVWDLVRLVEDHPVDVLGIAWDIRHATVEGGTCWPLNFRLARPHIGIVYAKDFVWRGRRAENVPLGEGMVDPKFYQLLSGTKFAGPINLHVEYAFPETPGAAQAAILRDLATLRSYL